jgi:hypothetical protein
MPCAFDTAIVWALGSRIERAAVVVEKDRACRSMLCRNMVLVCVCVRERDFRVEQSRDGSGCLGGSG